MNKRLQKMITNNLIPNKGGVFIDAYNQTINTEIAGTITTRVDASNMVYITEIIPLNTDKDGNCSCIKAGYYKMGGANFLKHQNDGFKATCIMEINATTICLNSKVDGKQPSLQDRVYDCNGVSTALTTCFLPNIAEPRVIQVGNIYPDTETFHNRTMGRVYSADGLSPTINCCGGGDREPKILTPRRTEFGKQIRKQYEAHQVDMSRHDMTQLEPREDGVSNTLTSVQKDNLVAEPLLIPEATTKGYAEAYDGDSVNLALPNSKTRRGRVGHQQANTLDTSCNQGVVVKEQFNTIIGNKQQNPHRGSVSGVAPCITSACGAGGGMTPMLTDADLETTKTTDFIEQLRGHQELRYRIRKLTPRECFRLMDVSETDIDKLLNAGISNSQLYKLAGNSIVCSVIYHVLRKLLIEKENENQQLTLF